MGRYEKQDTTGGLDILTGISTSKIKDRKTGEEARGTGFTDEEAERDAWKNLKSKKDGCYTEGDKSDGDSGGGICYLTTACTSARSLPDNCLELEVLRAFRDRILMPTSVGRKAVEEYYKIAPEIVQAIGKQANAQSVWQTIYRDVRQAVSLVLSGNFEKAFEHYQEMTLKLKGKYLN